jgi:UDP-N-acetylenolpyruvoylglucosamine reductase
VNRGLISPRGRPPAIADVLALMEITRERVHAQFNIMLEPEIRILGE